MKTSRYLLARLAWTVFAAWLVISGTFFLFAFTPDPNDALQRFAVGFQAATSGENATQAIEAYMQARSPDRPLLTRYVDWVVSYATFDWGESAMLERPVLSVVASRGAVTLTYLLPAMAVSVVVGTLVGLFSAMRERSVLDYFGRATAYLGLGLPNFWLATVLSLVLLQYFDIFALEEYATELAATAPENLPVVAVAGVVVMVNVLAVQTRYARSEARDYLPADFVKTLRSTGASGVSVARHVLRNASIPLVSLLFTEVLVVVMIDVFVVESVLEIPGLGYTAKQAIEQGDIGLILGTWMLPMLVVLFGSLLQDLLYALLDPRIGDDD